MAWVGALLLGAALVLLCYTALTWFWTVRRMAGISASIPGPRTLPLVGNFLDVPFGNLQCFVKNLIRDHGYLFRLWIGPLLLVFVLDPDDLEVVTSPAAAAACGDKPKYGYNIARQIIGHGMLTKNGASHRRSRKLIQPSLHREVLAQFQPLMHIEAVALARDLQAKAQTGEVFNITPMIAKTSLNAAFRTVLSADEELYKMMGTRLCLLVDGIERQSHLIMLRAMRPWLLCDAIFRFHEHYDDYYYLTNQYEQMILDVLEYREKRGNKQSAAGAASDDDPDAPQPRRRQAFLDLLLSSEGSRSLSRDELLGEVKLFTIASAATSQDTMATQMLLLALLPDVQAKIQSELDDLFGDSDRPLEMDDLKHLDYLDRFIKEGLRMLPPFPLFARDCKKDLPLRSGHTIPAGAYILFSPLATQHNPKYFPEPLRFDPDRWLPEAMAKRPPCSYFAFSAGPRNCIGMPYATIFVKTCIATVLRRYTLLPDPDGPQDISQIKMRLGLTYYPRDGSKVRVAMRRAMAATPG